MSWLALDGAIRASSVRRKKIRGAAMENL